MDGNIVQRISDKPLEEINLDRDVSVAVDSLEDIGKQITKINQNDVDPLSDEIDAAYKSTLEEEESIKNKVRDECKDKLSTEDKNLKGLQVRLKEVIRQCAVIEKQARSKLDSASD